MTRRVLFAALLLLLPAAAHAAAAQISGKVVDANDKPLAADVFVYTASPREAVRTICGWCCRDCTRKAAADANGQFLLREVDPTLRYRLLVVAKGYDPALVDTVADRPVTVLLRSRADEKPELLVRGTVVDPDGKPVLGAIVEPMSSVAKAAESPSITDGAGEFALRVRNARAVINVRVRGRNFAPTRAVSLTTDKAQRITVGPGVTVTGRVTHDGKPIPGARVGYAHEVANQAELLDDGQIGTDVDGRFVLTALAPNARYRIFPKMVSLRPLVSPTLLLSTSDPGATQDAGLFEVVKGVRVAGTIKGVAGKVPDGTVIKLSRRQDEQTVPVGADGSFVFEGVPPERVRLLVRVLGYRGKVVPFKATHDIDDLTINIGQ